MFSSGRTDGILNAARWLIAARDLSVALLLTTFAVPFLVPGLRAQDLPEIQTDRPDATECPFIVPAGYVQLETGFSFERTSSAINSVLHPSSLLRWGLTGSIEVRFTVEMTTVRQGEDRKFGLLPVSAGWKIHIMDEDGWLPQAAFIHHLTFPKVASPAFRGSHIAPEFRFAMQHTLSDMATLGYNVGLEWNGVDPDPTLLYTLSTGVSLFDHAGAFVELIGFAAERSSVAHTLAGGCTFLPARNLLLDISFGVGLTDIAPDVLVATGLSFRLME